MPLKPQKRSHDSNLPEFQPLLFRIVGPIQAFVSTQDATKENVQFVLECLSEPYASADPPVKLSVRHGNTVGNQADGTPSLLAQLIHAVHPHDLSKPELQDFDLETLPGRLVTVIGRIKDGDSGRFWNPFIYRRPDSGNIAGVSGSGATTAATSTQTADADYRYTADGAHRWKPGMAAWEPVPAAAPPPPPPAAPATPPPPPAPSAPPQPATTPPAPPAPEIKF